MSRFERRKHENQARIRDAALELFVAKGMRGTTIAEICERADVAKRTFFNHFPTLDDLIRSIARQRALGLEELIEAKRHEGVSATEALRGIFELIADYLETTGPMYRELVGEMMHITLASGDDETIHTGVLHGAFRRFVEDGVKQGSVTRRHRPEVLTDILVGTLTSVLSNWTTLPDYGIRRGLRQAGRALSDLLDARHDEIWRTQ